MKLVDGDLEYQLPKCYVAGEDPTSKYVFHKYEFTDYNAATYMGAGATKLLLVGNATSAELEVVKQATKRGALYTLYYPSDGRDDDDRYYQRVLTLPAKSTALGPDLHAYTIEAHALDGHAYDVDTGLRVN